MVIVRMKIGDRRFYSVNGYHIRMDAMDAIGKEIFTEEGWDIIAKQVAKLGFAACTIGTDGITPKKVKAALDNANKKIANLEDKVAKLVKGDCYERTGFP